MRYEDYATWQTLNRLFTEACPSVHFHDEDYTHLKFMFVSDHDKGLDESCN